ncbi:hypothetical protein LCGC14_2033410 [marine sediment metagenome]|uniref:Uncharacterized protein n=1 Tax=marine sediment metagenome TaxID=412755 RepID=A0A0F9H7H6_9ZZZZ
MYFVMGFKGYNYLMDFSKGYYFIEVNGMGIAET